jgi:hypothetical protein
LLRLRHLLELLVDLAGAFAGLGELFDLGEGLADAGLGVGEFAFGAVAGGGLVLVEAVEAVFEAGDEAAGVGVAQACRVVLDLAVGDAVECQEDVGAAEGAPDVGGDGEAAEVAGLGSGGAHAVEVIDGLGQEGFEVVAASARLAWRWPSMVMVNLSPLVSWR